MLPHVLLDDARYHAAHLGQHEVPPLVGAQLLAQARLEAMALAADGRMRQTKLLAGTGEAPLLRDDLERFSSYYMV
jgi:hypothetical protein